MDLDLGLAFALVGEDRYQELAERLRNAGFQPDTNAEGQPTRQRWRISDPPVTVDFLIEPEDAVSKAGKLFNLEADFAAIIAPGMHLAFQDKKKVSISGTTINGESATREVWVFAKHSPVTRASKQMAVDGVYLDRELLIVNSVGNSQVSAATAPAQGFEPTGWTVGQKKMLAIRVNFTDNPGAEPITEAQLNTAYDQVKEQLPEFSYGKFSLAAQLVVTPTITLPNSSAYYHAAGKSWFDELATDARTIAAGSKRYIQRVV